MKVLISCVPVLVGGGVQVSIALLAGLRDRPDVQWKAIVPTSVRAALPADLADDERITYVNRRSQADRVWLTPWLRMIERTFEPDVVFTVFGPPFGHARAPHLVGFALPHMIYENLDPAPRSSLKDRLGDWARCHLFRQADCLVVETEAARQRLARRLTIDVSRIFVVPNSPNPLLQPLPEDPARQSQRFVIFIPSAYYRHKNLEIVPRVAQAMRRAAPDIDFEFRFTLPPLSAEWQRITAEAAQLGVSEKLTTLGVVKIVDLASAYRDASAVFLPTLREVSTAVYPESFLFRRPLVTSDLDFARELCGDGALFADPLNPEASAARLVDLASQPQLRTQMVAKGERQLAATYPSPARKLDMQIALLEKVAVMRDAGQPHRASVTNTRTPAAAPEPALSGTSAIAASDAAVRFHDDIAIGWDDRYKRGGFARRAKFFSKTILPQVATRGRWLDAGCGSGYFSRLVASHGNVVTGVDASDQMIEAARKLTASTPGLSNSDYSVVETVERLPFADGEFDGCLCLSVLEYVSDPEACLAELSRVTAPGGMVILSVPHRFAPVRLGQSAAGALFRRASRSRWQYMTLSRYAATTAQLQQSLAVHGLPVRAIYKFDAAVPQALLRIVPPSLLFAVAIKEGVRQPQPVQGAEPLATVT
jgi:2-polyprenyl-3-methyl-5-hydroxy-6-metoxy-1,4-benzoquinol methylase/glycosyltransferase involved in cell wall biosynthesis